MTRNPATERQIQAADPVNSTWLSANAGSGKTRVLTDRVARLLLDHVRPERILCLTYTKAAASEMQNRLFSRLGNWAMLDDTELGRTLWELGVDGPVDPDMLRQARRLFARAIETPGGLKIQTIHSFCAGLLRRFPLEAGVSPGFADLDERTAKRLRAEIVEDMAEGPEAGLLADLARYYTGDDLDGLTAEIAGHRDRLAKSMEDPAIWRLFGLPREYDETTLLAQVFLGGENDLIRQVVPVLAAGSKTDQKAAATLDPLVGEGPGLPLLTQLEGLFLTGATAKSPFSAKIGSFPTKATQKALGSLMADLDALMVRVEDARQRRIALSAARRTRALHRFAGAFLKRYEARKLAQGWLDFDDMILKARTLLTDPGVAQWVLFRLDGGLDHILVDEAQDTSPVQWDVIELLAQEFTAGEGARSGVERTIFVVGDKKQSIYSFQGADPDGFDRMKATFRDRLAGIDRNLVPLTLEYSFRSAEAILSVVDKTFPPDTPHGLDREMRHRAFHGDLPGRVDLWPVVEESATDEPGHWADPVDMPAAEHHMVRLARRVAAEVRAMIDRGETLAVKHKDGRITRRPVTEGDFLILVQRRSDLFYEIIRACKAEGLEIAGADRLKIAAELAVRDLVALLSFLALPEDDLSLACALRSPLFGWSEDALYRLGAKRGKAYLWQTLRGADWAETETVSVLKSLRDEADFLRPYELLERILTRHDGRRRLTARLGQEAEDGIDALLDQALAYERVEVPSLTGFLAWLESGEVEVKRQLDSAGDRIRVMTVHGAKGLEAPIVILPDCGARRVDIRDQLLTLDDGSVVWKTPSGERPTRLEDAYARRITREQAERQRLLYVAMTRAEQWLIVGAAGKLSPDGSDWYSLVQAGMHRAGADPQDFAFGAGLRVDRGHWQKGDVEQPADIIAQPADLPEWAMVEVPRPERPAQPVSPSNLGGAKILGGDGEGLEAEAAKARGTWIHLLLEHLTDVAEEARAQQASALLTTCTPSAAETEIAQLVEEAQRILATPDLAHVFAPETLAEVELAAPIGQTMIRGTIDRLLVAPDHVLAVDFKTNAVVPSHVDDVPEGLLRQMGAYAQALTQIYPAHRIETAILWTRTATLMPIPPGLAAAALARAALP
ncbi:ATP-dependent nuclease subunit A [Rhodovulum sp. P5]|uniref:double-strand break repair helicase AddA n=1 Tax=Rhodovulum sp. P5 TaxID=1564506 RepID=UPI0009C21403|nr:double-strand break repair helicase AddA [Rhodovulum sp. P5]ARE40589.1 ATP-dependent nuclease subunit A [Rhodovulum sp. P5]